MRTAIRDLAQLGEVLGLPAAALAGGHLAQQDFPVFVPRPFLARIRPGDLQDPLLRQVLPLPEETDPVAHFVADPVGDLAAQLRPGVLQKYRGRALLMVTGRCAVHCRYCFRRHFPYTAATAPAAWDALIEPILQDATLREVLLSGGDPLTLVDASLGALVERLAAVPHVHRLRVHTRLPVMIPDRVTDALLNLLTGTRLTPLVVLHLNHAQEIDDAVARAVARLVDAGVPLLNQAVLLAGVNDTFRSQHALCEHLVDLRVMPYYLHQLDRVAGAAHFEVPVEQGRRLIAQLRERLPGYAVPRYVREVAGGAGKEVLA